MSKVTDIDEHSPHYAISCDNGDQHVIPTLLIDNIVVGKICPTVLGVDVLRAIVKEWHSSYR